MAPCGRVAGNRKTARAGSLDESNHTRRTLGDDAAWASFATAVAPGRHGRFFWHIVDRGSYDWIMSRERPPPIPPFWVALSDAGRRVAVIDVPKCPLTPGIRGRQLVD